MCGYTLSAGFRGNIEIDVVVIYFDISIRHTRVQGHNSFGSQYNYLQLQL